MSRIFLYSRVSTQDQDTTNQVLEAERAGFAIAKGRIVEETVSGTVPAMGRAGFAALVEHKLEEGDTLVVTKLDRLGRNTADVLATVERLHAKGVRLHCLAIPGTDLTSPAGKFTLTVLAAVSQLERDLLVERTHAGLERARAEGRVGGRPERFTPAQKQEIRARLEAGATARGLAKEYGTTHVTILKAAQAA
ncbi:MULTISPECIES: recombinase family protein [unclassified Caballeronia]|uniref:recombinase family protein n=1 Tax=unclassified Caballeronia TaxID=2646786 RepID=UPI0028567F20|nr:MULTISPECIES: recombinase family protein [unclassified Caballeronia]MDR5772147.1 recombinase family protein [Caballeronia sp. LZ002]MDR5804420.1 recombinase family protein [Caballeronia sp. LZ001]MDR5847581.1 recombinase family protein [Caballeronia sp. LZ003]